MVGFTRSQVTGGRVSPRLSEKAGSSSRRWGARSSGGRRDRAAGDRARGARARLIEDVPGWEDGAGKGARALRRSASSGGSVRPTCCRATCGAVAVRPAEQGFPVPPGRFSADSPGRRGQPHDAAHAGGAPGGDERFQVSADGKTYAAETVHGGGNAEPAGVRGHVSPARPARPVHAADPDGLPLAGAGAGNAGLTAGQPVDRLPVVVQAKILEMTGPRRISSTPQCRLPHLDRRRTRRERHFAAGVSPAARSRSTAPPRRAR